MNEFYSKNGSEIQEIITYVYFNESSIDDVIKELENIKKQAKENGYYNIEFADNGGQWETVPVIIATRKNTTPSYKFV